MLKAPFGQGWYSDSPPCWPVTPRPQTLLAGRTLFLHVQAFFPVGWDPHHTGCCVLDYLLGFRLKIILFPAECIVRVWDSFLSLQLKGLLSVACWALGSGHLRLTCYIVKSYLWLHVYHVPGAYSVYYINHLISSTKDPTGEIASTSCGRGNLPSHTAKKQVWKPDPPLWGSCSLHYALLKFINY